MVICNLCGKKYKNNLGGQFTVHLNKKHKTTLEDYIIFTKYGDVAPKCKCGLCDEKPIFYRGKFKSYAVGHRAFDNRTKMYVEKYGMPKCLYCNEEINKFNRSKPTKYCSMSCVGKHNGGFVQEKTQEKIRNVIMERYGVSNILLLPHNKEKSLEALKNRVYTVSEETKIKNSIASKKMWQNKEYRKKIISKIRLATNTPEEKNRRSIYQKNRMATDKEYVAKLRIPCKSRTTNLHIRIRDYLDLFNLGFKSEQRIGRKFIDELNEEKKIAIEINGDYTHANPLYYQENDIIKLPGQAYTAKYKWEKDKEKIDYLESLGYKVFIIWESDDLNIWKQTIDLVTI